MIDPATSTCQVLPVRQLHGGSVKKWLNHTMAAPGAARPGEIIALRMQGYMQESGAVIERMTFIVQGLDGAYEARLLDLPDALRGVATACGYVVDNDWEILEELPCEFLEPGEEGPTVLELIHCPGALVFLWLRSPRNFNTSPALSPAISQPAAMFVEEDDIQGIAMRSCDGGDPLVKLCERLAQLKTGVNRPFNCGS